MEVMPIQSIVWTPDGYRASGADGLRVAIWGSDDAVDWDLLSTQSQRCCDRFEQSAALARHG